MGKTPNPTARPERPTDWNDWYRFAREELGYEHDERVEYANHRIVEVENRAALARRATASRRGRFV